MLTMGLAAITAIGWGQFVSTTKLHEYVSRQYLTVQVYTIEQNVVDDERTYCVWDMYYQNAKYEHISDRAHIMFFSQEEVIKFVEDFELIVSLDKNSDSTIRRDKYSFRTSPLSIFIYDEDNKYTYLPRNKAIKLINDIKSHLNLMCEESEITE